VAKICRRIRTGIRAFLCVAALASGPKTGAAGSLEAVWQDRFLTVSGAFPGETIRIHYLEAYCRAGSTDRDWKETVIPHTSRLLPSDNPAVLHVEDQLQDGVIVEHRVTTQTDGLEFLVTARNPTDQPSAAHWAQPCVRIDAFTGQDPSRARESLPPYIRQCFLAIDNELVRLPTQPWATAARYQPGQVYCPADVPRGDVNPRPLSSLIPSHGLCGCVSADGRWIMGVVWEPYQEVFQGVVSCIHADFRIGGLLPGESKTIRGRLYVLEGDKAALLAAYRRDFPDEAVGLGVGPIGTVNPEDPRPDSLTAALDTIRAVGREGLGNAAAAVAWEAVAGSSAERLPSILAALDGANPLAANWLRASVDAIASREQSLPLAAIEAFLADTTHAPRGRRLAWELLRSRNPSRAQELIAGMLDDPSVELRHDAVARLLEVASRQQTSDPAAATNTLQAAVAAARDVNQIKDITQRLRKAGVSVDLQRQFGFLCHWQVAGPFDNTGEDGFAAVYPPEETVDLQAEYAGKDGSVRWRDLVTTDSYGMVDINKAYPGPGDGLKEVVAYAYTRFTAAESRDAEIRLGCKNAWKVWHNGRLVFGRDEYHRGMRIDQYRLPIRLDAGLNTFLVKVCQDGQTKDWTKEWQFQFRICDAAGTAILATDRPPTPTEAAPSPPASEDGSP
jgi:hypothetical protein